MEEERLTKLERAKKRVEKIKGFYRHLLWYVVVNLVLLFVELRMYDFFNIEIHVNQGFRNWVNYNFIVTPLLWGIGLAIHGLAVFRYKFGFFDKWEKRQIERYMEEDKHSRWE